MIATTQTTPLPKINKGKIAYPKVSTQDQPQRYIKVSDDSELRLFVKSSRWSECIACKSINGHYCSPNTWMIPEDLYNLVMEH